MVLHSCPPYLQPAEELLEASPRGVAVHREVDPVGVLEGGQVGLRASLVAVLWVGVVSPLEVHLKGEVALRQAAYSFQEGAHLVAVVCLVEDGLEEEGWCPHLHE